MTANRSSWSKKTTNPRYSRRTTTRVYHHIVDEKGNFILDEKGNKLAYAYEDRRSRHTRKTVTPRTSTKQSVTSKTSWS